MVEEKGDFTGTDEVYTGYAEKRRRRVANSGWHKRSVETKPEEYREFLKKKGIAEWVIDVLLSLKTVDEKRAYLDRLERNPFLMYRPHAVQDKFHRSTARVRLFLGGNRSGKSMALVQEVIWWFTGLHPYRKVVTPVDIWVVSLDFPSSRDVVQPMIRRIIGTGYLKEWRETDKIITGTNGSTIGFRSCDSGWEKFQGSARHLIAFDEEPEYNVYQECVMRTVSTKGDIILALTPLHGMTWVFDELYEPWLEKRNEDIECFISSTRDNPYIDVKEIERIEKTFYDEEREARLEGKFVEFAGLIYKEFDRRVHLIPRFPIPEHWTRVRAIDPGVNNPTAVVWLAVSPDDEMYVYDEYYQTDKTIKDFAEDIKIKTGPDKISYTVIDPAACSRNPAHPELRSVREEYARCGIWTMPGNNDVSYGINAVKEKLHPSENTKRPQLYFFDDLENFKKELIRYRWDTFRHHAEDKNSKEKPKKVMDHLMDALRYAIASGPRYVEEVELAEIGQTSFKPTRS